MYRKISVVWLFVRRLLATKKRQGSLGNVGIRMFDFNNFQADTYGTSSGYDERNYEYRL